MVDPEVGNKVPDQHVLESKGVAQEDENRDGDGKTQVTQQDELGILGLVEGAGWIEVIDTIQETVLLALATTLLLTLMEVVARDIGQQIVGPSNDLLANEVNQGDNRCLLTELTEFVDESTQSRGLLLTGAGDENHVSLHVAGCLMVLAMRYLPAKVRNEEG